MAAVVVVWVVVVLVVVVICINMQCNHMITLKSGIVVPCGKCAACKANERQEWIFRLKQEFLDSCFSIFVTLTYSDDNLPGDLSVNKKDVQLFHKRLRKHFPPGDLRFYVVSEYGDHTYRPHYHGLYFFKSKYQKSKIYDIFESSWSLGFIKFGDVEEGSIVYCTKYCLKHSLTPPGRKSTFRLLSKMNGGLGSRYLRYMSDFHISNPEHTFVSYAGKNSRMPRYYRTKLGLSIGTDEYMIKLRESSYEHFKISYRDFIRRNGLSDGEDTRSKFVEFWQKSRENRDELILKHTKKQNF